MSIAEMYPFYYELWVLNNFRSETKLGGKLVAPYQITLLPLKLGPYLSQISYKPLISVI